MLKAGFAEVQNGLWLKELTAEEYEELAADFEKPAPFASSDKK